MKFRSAVLSGFIGFLIPMNASANCSAVLSTCTQDCLNLPPDNFMKKMSCMSDCRDRASTCEEDQRSDGKPPNSYDNDNSSSYSRYNRPQATLPPTQSRRNYRKTPVYQDTAPSRTIEKPLNEKGQACVSTRTFPTKYKNQRSDYAYEIYEWELTNRCNAFATVKFTWNDTGRTGQKTIRPNGNTLMRCTTAGKKRTCSGGFSYTWSIKR